MADFSDKCLFLVGTIFFYCYPFCGNPIMEKIILGQVDKGGSFLFIFLMGTITTLFLKRIE